MRSLHHATLAVAAVGVLTGCGLQTPAASDRHAATRTARPRATATPPAASASTRRSERPPAAAPVEPPTAGTVFRPDDTRPHHDDAALEQLGIRRYASRRLLLYSDLPAERVADLPKLVDAVYDEWVAYFGELPPARDGADYQLTGYLIGDLDRFRSAKLLPDDITFEHGLHRGQEFWLRDQQYDYYRAHLLLHEATHCFMTALPRSEAAPVWYMEGMAECFGTHRILDGRVEFRVMPRTPEESAGFGRITLVRDEIAAGRFKPLDEVRTIRPAEFSQNSSYAWSWALCAFLDAHPGYKDRFRALGDPRLRQRFDEEFDARFADDLTDLSMEWAHFAHTLRYGYDIERAAITFHPGADIEDQSPATARIAADRGWQSSGVRIEAGKPYTITAEGRFTLADDPKPWTSTAAGITFDYFDGRPLGRLTAAILADSPGETPDPARGLLTPIDVGTETTLVAPATGTLYFRVNDRWDRLADNRGELTVSIKRSGAP